MLGGHPAPGGQWSQLQVLDGSAPGLGEGGSAEEKRAWDPRSQGSQRLQQGSEVGRKRPLPAPGVFTFQFGLQCASLGRSGPFLSLHLHMGHVGP